VAPEMQDVDIRRSWRDGLCALTPASPAGAIQVPERSEQTRLVASLV